ncbi:AAA-type ATPase [Giardia lamblia P15]|uniref:AAA-type ATPase n=1 Tax=Giardia intestinalis (strain P15) TaxID=658858 RepID=E1F7W1_GIAIA|nr:AAA-type ATPase [Giardia lamblia P15]
MHLRNWERHVELHPYSWYFEAPQDVLDGYGLQHGNIIRILLDGTCYICITYRRDKPKITIGGCITLSEDPIVGNFHRSNKQITELNVEKLSSGLVFKSDSDSISLYLPSAFRHTTIKEEAASIIKLMLHGAPYLRNTWMDICFVMVKMKIRIPHTEESIHTEPDGNSVTSIGFPPVSKLECSWIGCTAVKDKLKYCLSSPSVSHFLVSGPRGSGKMTLLKTCLHRLEKFTSLIVSANDLLEGKNLWKEYTSDSILSPDSTTASNRILSQVTEGCIHDFFSSYSDFLRALAVPHHEHLDFSLLSRKWEATQGRANLSSSLTDLIVKANAYDFLIFREFDSVFVQRSDLASPEQRQLTSTLLMLLDGSTKHSVDVQGRCKYIGIVTDLTTIDTALRRPGRFEEAVTLTNPTFEMRSQFLQKVFADRGTTLDSSIVESLTKATASMPLGDIKELLTTHSTDDQVHLVEAMQQYVQEFRGQNTLELSGELSSCRVPDPNPFEPFEAVSVHEDVLCRLIDIILMPVLYKDLFWKLIRSKSSGNILCMGCAGSGKTFLIRRLIRQLSGRINFFELNCAQVFSLYVGHTERNIRRAFQEARSNMPSVLILDNYDSLAENRDSGDSSGDSVASRVLATLLVELDGLSTGTFGQVTVLAITSRPDHIDRALIRPGRIDHKIFIGYLPTETIMGEKMWTEIEKLYNLTFADVIAIKECVRNGYNRGLCVTIGIIIRKSRLLASKAVSLEQALDDLTKAMVVADS